MVDIQARHADNGRRAEDIEDVVYLLSDFGFVARFQVVMLSCRKNCDIISTSRRWFGWLFCFYCRVVLYSCDCRVVFLHLITIRVLPLQSKP